MELIINGEFCGKLDDKEINAGLELMYNSGVNYSFFTVKNRNDKLRVGTKLTINNVNPNKNLTQ